MNLPFDLLSDWDRETSKKYGTFNEKEMVANRKSLLIDKSGMVRFVQESGLEQARNHKEMLDAVKKLKDAGAEEASPDKQDGQVDAIFYEFYSDTCSHCKEMKPVVDEFEKTQGGRFKKFLLIPFKGPDNITIFHEYRVMGTPTFIITDIQGTEVDRISGVHSLDALVNFTDSAFRRLSKMQKEGKNK